MDNFCSTESNASSMVSLSLGQQDVFKMLRLASMISMLLVPFLPEASFWACPCHHSPPIQDKISKFGPKMHLSTVKIPVNFGLDWHCPSISFLIAKPILYQPEKMLFVYTWVRPPVSSHPPYATCVGWLASWKLQVVSLKYQYFDTVFRQGKCDRTITICVNAYRKRTIRTVLTNMWHQIRQEISDSTTENPEYRPEPYGLNSPQHGPTFWHSSVLGYFPSKFPPNQTLSES